MSVQVYILWSAALQRHYVGFSESSARRLREHRSGQTFWTRRASDWQKVWERMAANRTEARVLERQIKARGARRFLEDQMHMNQTNIAAPLKAGSIPPEAG
jgi:putative endonuclease